MLSKSLYNLKFASGDLTSAERVVTLYMNMQLPLSQFWSIWGVASGRGRNGTRVAIAKHHCGPCWSKYEERIFILLSFVEFRRGSADLES